MRLQQSVQQTLPTAATDVWLRPRTLLHWASLWRHLVADVVQTAEQQLLGVLNVGVVIG